MTTQGPRACNQAASAQPGAVAEHRHRHRRRSGTRGPDDAVARPGPRRQANVALSPRRQQGRNPRRHHRHRVRRDRTSPSRHRLADGHASACDLSPSGPGAPPLGDPSDGVTKKPRPGHPGAPRRSHRHPSTRRLLDRNDRPCLLTARQLHLRLRPSRSRLALRQ